VSGETEGDVSGWTVDTLHAHLLGLLRERDIRFDQRFVAQQEATRSALGSAERAVEKAEASIEQRLVLLNELRTDVATKAEVDALDKILVQVMTRLDRMEAGTQGGQAKAVDQRAFIASAVGVVGLLITIVVVIANVLT
jgi:t-SNARE complex subunit (syntaxin)